MYGLCQFTGVLPCDTYCILHFAYFAPFMAMAPTQGWFGFPLRRLRLPTAMCQLFHFGGCSSIRVAPVAVRVLHTGLPVAMLRTYLRYQVHHVAAGWCPAPAAAARARARRPRLSDARARGANSTPAAGPKHLVQAVQVQSSGPGNPNDGGPRCGDHGGCSGVGRIRSARLAGCVASLATWSSSPVSRESIAFRPRQTRGTGECVLPLPLLSLLLC